MRRIWAVALAVIVSGCNQISSERAESEWQRACTHAHVQWGKELKALWDCVPETVQLDNGEQRAVMYLWFKTTQGHEIVRPQVMKVPTDFCGESRESGVPGYVFWTVLETAKHRAMSCTTGEYSEWSDGIPKLSEL